MKDFLYFLNRKKKKNLERDVVDELKNRTKKPSFFATELPSEFLKRYSTEALFAIYNLALKESRMLEAGKAKRMLEERGAWQARREQIKKRGQRARQKKRKRTKKVKAKPKKESNQLEVF